MLFRSLSIGSLGTVSLLNLIWVWGETQVGLVLLQTDDAYTIPIGLLSFQGTWVSNPGALFAGLTMATVPIIGLYLIFHRSVTKGVSLDLSRGAARAIGMHSTQSVTMKHC